MDPNRFEDIAKAWAVGTDRRAALKRLAGGLLAGLAAVSGGGVLRGDRARAQPGCRQEGHPCEGNQVCCPGLVCVQAAGPGQAARCVQPTTTKCPTTTTKKPTTTTKKPTTTTKKPTTTTKRPTTTTKRPQG